MKRAIFLLLPILGVVYFLAFRPAPDLDGDWFGRVEVSPGVSIPLTLHISTEQVTLDSPEQSVFGLVVDTFALKGKQLRFSVDSIGFSFEGECSEVALAGEASQGGESHQIAFSREPHAAVRRPQERQGPFPYVVEEVVVESGAIELAGTLTLPKGGGPFPAVLLVTGSGPQDRDETICGHKPFAVLADHLTRHGIAVLRLDDRGFGESTGSFSGAVTADFAQDALAAVAFLKERSEVGPIGLVGHSEGGIVAPMASLESEEISFLVLLAGMGLSGEEVIYQQQKGILKGLGWAPSLIESHQGLMHSICSVVKDEVGPGAQKEIAALLDGCKEEGLLSWVDEMRSQIGSVNNNWFRAFLVLDPSEIFSKVSVPVLALSGGRDVQVDARSNLQAIGMALESGGNRDYALLEFPGLNHLFQTCETGLPSEYGLIEETISPVVLTTISEWILEQCSETRSAPLNAAIPDL